MSLPKRAMTVVDVGALSTPPKPEWNYACGFCWTRFMGVGRTEWEAKAFELRHEKACMARITAKPRR